jgi:SAM-dependent methyltransferase
MNGTTSAIWHDVECGGYAADLSLWEELAERQAGPILELGCGTGRVALHLARRGHELVALDRDEALIASLRERAKDLALEALIAEATEFKLGKPVSLVLAPMQFLHLLPDSSSRQACLKCIAAELTPGGFCAIALLGSRPRPAGKLPPLPDVREVDGWIYSSLPTAIGMHSGKLLLQRLRQTVSPDGDLKTAEINLVELLWIDPAMLELEAESVGLFPVEKRIVPATEDHVASKVLVLEKA